MKPFDCNGKQIVFTKVAGTVAGAHKRAETSISGSGGGGSSWDGRGRTEPVTITSTVSVKQEFFLKTPDGKQVPVQLSDEDIPIMDGQKVTMIAGHAGKERRWTHLVNHDTELFWRIGNAKVHAITLGLVRTPLVSFMLGIVTWIAVAYVLNGWIGFIGAIGFWVFEWQRLRRASGALAEHINDLGKEALNSGQAPT
jgi:hypothetical protein